MEKDLVREQDSSNKRGFSIDQRIHIEAINLQKLRDNDRKRKSLMVALSIQEGSLARQIELYEKRAMRLSPDDMSSVHWKCVDELLKRQDGVVQEIEEINKA